MEHKYQRHTIQSKLLEPLPSWNPQFLPDYGPSLSWRILRILGRLLRALVSLALQCILFFLILSLMNWLLPG